MSKKEKKVIFVAESSRVLLKIITTELESKGYEVHSFNNGFACLKQIVKETPSLIIADKNLPSISGIELCKIMKTGSVKEAIPFIITSIDDSVFDFWNSAREANRVVLIQNDNIEVLSATVKELLDYQYVENDTFLSDDEEKFVEEQVTPKAEDETLVSWIISAMDKSDFFLNMAYNVILLCSSLKELKLLVENIFRMLYSACSFDIAALILDSPKAKLFMTGTEFFDNAICQEFWNICKVEYEKQAKKNHSITYDGRLFSDVVLSKPKRKKFESYRSFTIKCGNDFIGTLHLASTRKKIFNYKIQSSIEFVIPALAFLLQESVQRGELTQRESKLRTAFSKFVPEEVINDFLHSDENKELKNNNEKRNVVILMSDIRSFTSISEINKPEVVVNFLNTYFTRMVDIVKKYGGTVDKFIGDAIMVLFGAPISYNDNAKRAVQAAIEMYAQLDTIPYGQLKFPEGMKLDIGIGIHYGDVIVGQIGSADKTNYTVIGDTVNLASRLEGLTKLYGAKVIISQAVYDELDDSINALLLDSVKVKGKKEAVYIYRTDEKPLPKAFTQAYEKGFKSYNEGAFSLAIPYFEKAVSILPNDKAAKLMLERCNEFAVNKPENWDGAIALTSK